MARLFITPRELDFFSDITKEVMKDVIAQVIYYFSISETKTHIDDLYNEAPEKIFENPIQLDALVEFEPQDVRTGLFGTEDYYSIKAWVHERDLLDKKIQLSIGDFFSYGSVFYEITAFKVDQTIYGQVEHKTGYLIEGKEARKSQFVSKVFGPTDERFSDQDAVQTTYVQQRGKSTNRLGDTGDVRELQRQGVVDKPLTGPHEVSDRGSRGSSADPGFYGDEDV